MAKSTTTKKGSSRKAVESRRPAAAKKAAPVRATRGGKAAPAAKAKTAPIDKALTKAQLFNTLAEGTGLAKKDVAAVVDGLMSVIARHLAKKGAGLFTFPGLLKIQRVEKPATKARMGRNPRTGEPMEIAARPARTSVRLRALKGLKQMI